MAAWHAGRVPDFQPFAALRYAADELADVVAPPYDVLSAADAGALQARSPHNITHVDVPGGGADRYEHAGQILRTWTADGVLVPDREPGFTVYRMRFTDATGTDREITGVLGGLQVLDPDERSVPPVLPHERTTPKASTDRLELTRATQANLSPVWGLSLATGLTDLLRAPGEPVGEVTVDGVTHRVERIADPDRVSAIARHVAADAVLLADGHHRYGVARIYRDETRARTGRRDSAAEHTLAFVSELVADQLAVEAIHRLYRGIDPASLHAQLADRFALTPTETPTAQTLSAMVAEGFLVLVTREGCHRLTPRPGAFGGLRALDGLWLEHTLGDAVDVDYQHGLPQTLAAVRDGRADAAVLIRPVPVSEIERTAREGVLMPPKSTFFTPKLRTGFVVRPLT